MVAIKEGAKICFGSGIVRNTSPIGNGLSPFQRRLMGEINKLAPGHYRTENITSATYQQLHKVYTLIYPKNNDGRRKDIRLFI